MDQRIDLGIGDEAENVKNPDGSNVIILEGTVLDNHWVIGKQIGSTEHAKIYSVTHQGHGDDSDIIHEARSFNFAGISPQVKSNRARARRRLSHRTVLSTTWNGLRVVIYRTGAIIQDKKQEIEDSPGDKIVADSACKKPRQKTARQQESDRLRQLFRRRRVKQERENAMLQDEEQQLEVYRNEFDYLEWLYLYHGDKATRQKPELVIRPEMEDYLAAIEKGVDNPSEDFHHDMSQFPRQFETGNAKPNYNYLLWREYKMLFGGLIDLPTVIQEAEEMVQMLQLKIHDARQGREKREVKQGVNEEKKRLGKVD